MKIICKDKELIPRKGTVESAGYDLMISHDIRVPVGEYVTVGTGVQVELPEGFAGMVIPRSSTGKKMLSLLNTIGVIDGDYQGEIILNIKNEGKETYLGYKYDALFQLVIVPVATVNVTVVDDFNKVTSRGKDGFGSTNIKSRVV